MSEYYYLQDPPEDENQNQTDYQVQNSGHHQNQSNGIQRPWRNQRLSHPDFIEPGQVGFAPNAGVAPWEQQPQQPQQPQMPQMPQEHPIYRIHHINQPDAMSQRNQTSQMQNMHQTPHLAIPAQAQAPAPAPASWHGYNPFQGIDLSRLSAAEYIALCSGSFSPAGPASSYTANDAYVYAEPASVQSQQQYGPHSIAGYPNGGHPNGGYPTPGHTLPPPPPQPLPAAPSTGGRIKRGRAASPNTMAPAPKRTRNIVPSASGAEGGSANNSGIPVSTPNTTSTPSRQPQRTRKRKADIDEEDDDDEDPRPPKKPKKRPIGPKKKGKGDDAEEADAGKSLVHHKREDHELATRGTICDFCANHPEGKEVYANNKICDWEQIPNGGPEVYNRECSNCANYRSRTKDHTELAKAGDHMCRVPGPITALIDFNYKRYGNRDPLAYLKKSCDNCSRYGWEETCDVDTILGYFCSNCRRSGSCHVSKSVMPVRRPNKLTRRPWFRHPCDRCLLRHKTFGEMKGDDCCSWITDRRQWEGNHACRQCQQNGAPCLDLGNLVALVSQRPMPSTWDIRSKFEKEEGGINPDRKVKWHEYAEVTTVTSWRKPCQACQTSGRGVSCLVMWFQPDYACERCTQFGIDCLVLQGDVFQQCPIYDLSRVGFGHFTPFKVCKQCEKAGRNCDRQRPCDSCRHHNAECDPMSYDRPGCIDRAKVAGKRNMGSYSPGHLYYLALGYGPSGVDDIKDGRHLEHWIGPVAPVYALADTKDRPRHYQTVANAHRHHRPPNGVPPPNGNMLRGRSLKDLTAQQLGNFITQLWHSPQVPKSNLQLYQRVWTLLRDSQNLKMSQADVGPSLTAATQSVRSFQGGPVLIDIERIQGGGLPSVYGYPGATQSHGIPQILPNQLPRGLIQYEGYQQQHPPNAQQIQPYQGPAAQQESGGLNQQQLDAHTQQAQPMQPSQSPAADEQEYRGLNQQQLDAHTQQPMQPSQGPADQRENGELKYNQYVYDQLQLALQIQRDQVIADEQENEDVGYGERLIFADGSAIPALPEAHDVENGQQESLNGPQTQGQAQDQAHTGSSDGSEPDIDRIVDYARGITKTYHRSRVNREERWHNTKTSKGSKGPLRERMAFGNRVPKSANTQEAFNPFLGFTFGPDQKPRFKEKPKSSRWKVFNHLEGIDMDEWYESKSKEAQDESQPRLFSVVNGQTDQPAPSRDVLGDVSYKQRGERTLRYCAEPGEGGKGYCGSWNTNERDQATCQSLAHRNTVPRYFPVCDGCTRGNVRYLFKHEHNPITEGELLSMRAYLCNDCAGQMSSGAHNATQNQTIGARRVYGIAADEENPQNIQKPDNDPSKTAEFISNTEALTGCSCANRMLGTSLCRFHRLYYAEEVMKHSALMQEWRLSRFKKAVCPSCLAQKPSEQVNVSANFSGFVTGAPTAWACVVCNDWVVNVQNDGNNQPKAIDKPLWNLNIGREILNPRRKITPGRVLEEEEVETMDG
jgi:hypothetical protein